MLTRPSIVRGAVAWLGFIAVIAIITNMYLITDQTIKNPIISEGLSKCILIMTGALASIFVIVLTQWIYTKLEKKEQ